MNKDTYKETDMSPVPSGPGDTTRPVYGTRKHRAEDLVEDDVVRHDGEWRRVLRVATADRRSTILFDDESFAVVMDVHLFDVQVVK